MGLGGTVLATHKAVRNGQEIEYNIEIALPSMKDEMTTEFLHREKVCSAIGFLKDTVSLRCSERYWREIVDNETALVAVIRKPQQKPFVIGMNMTYIWGSLAEKVEGDAMTKVVLGIDALRQEANLPVCYRVTKWLEAFGLSVGSKWHGLRVGESLLAAREPLCTLFGVSASFTVFTSEKVQWIAQKVGMETLVELDLGGLFGV